MIKFFAILMISSMAVPALACKMTIAGYSATNIAAGVKAFIQDHDVSTTITDVQVDGNIVNVRGVLNKAVVGSKYMVQLKSDCSTTTIPVEY